MNVLIVAPQFYPMNSGYANAITNFALALQRHGAASVTVIVRDNGFSGFKPKTEIIQTGVRVIRSGRVLSLLNELVYGLRIRIQIQRGQYDVVLMETLENPLAKFIAVLGLKEVELRKIIVRIHAATETEHYVFGRGLANKVYRWLARRLISRVRNIASTSHYYLGFVKEHYLGGDVFATFKNWFVFPNIAVPAATVQPAENEEMPAGTIALSPDHVWFLTLGRMDRLGYVQKNFELIAHAVYLIKLLTKDCYLRLRVLIVGAGSERDRFIEVVHSLDISPAFHFVESLPNDEVRRLQAAVDAVLLVSRYEGQSMFALESLAQGAPLIVSRGTALQEMVVPGMNGYLVDSDDAFDLAEAMVQITQIDRHQLRRGSAELYRTKFNPVLAIQRFVGSVALAKNSLK